MKMNEFNKNEPVVTVTMTEKWVWDCPNAKAAINEAKYNTQTAINDRVNWCMAEIERLKSLEMLDLWDLERYAAEKKYLQTTVSGCMLSFFYDLEALIDMKLDTEPNKQIPVQWTGDKFMQELFYNIFEKLNLDYSLDITRNIMFIKPKFRKIRDFDRKTNFFADTIRDIRMEQEDSK